MLCSYLLQLMRSFLNERVFGMIRDMPFSEDEVEKNMKKALINQEAIVKGKYLRF